MSARRMVGVRWTAPSAVLVDRDRGDLVDHATLPAVPITDGA